MKKLLKIFALLLAVIQLHGQNKPEGIDVKLSDASHITIEGSHRFIKIAGITGLQVTSLKTKAYVESPAMNAEKGSLSIWMSPMEDMNKFPNVGESVSMLQYPLVSDYFPPNKTDSSSFSVYYQGNHYPRVFGRFTKGSFWGQMDYGLAPFVYAEDLPLKKGQWYNFIITWDKPAHVLKMYINGMLVGHNFSAKSFQKAGNRLYVGNPLMVISRLKIQPEVLSEQQVENTYQQLRPESNLVSENTIREIVRPQNKPAIPFKPDASWKKAYECSFTNPEEFKKWTFQTGDLYRDKFKLEITKEGLYFETPDIIHTESRGYLWSPVSIEGDQWIEYEFQLVSPKGLALLIICATGLQGEDIINDHGLRKTGAMSDMNRNYRNYHWEYMRRVEAMRTDVETQYVSKNPWGKGLYVGCIPRFEQNRWYKMQFIKKGNRLYGAIDGKTVFDVEENPYDNNGSLLNSGRVVLRQMYHTAMKYRNFVIYTKDNN
jgi:hypothetical protein